MKKSWWDKQNYIKNQLQAGKICEEAEGNDILV
jgi:hypothetical protein